MRQQRRARADDRTTLTPLDPPAITHFRRGPQSDPWAAPTPRPLLFRNTRSVTPRRTRPPTSSRPPARTRAQVPTCARAGPRARAPPAANARPHAPARRPSARAPASWRASHMHVRARTPPARTPSARTPSAPRVARARPRSRSRAPARRRISLPTEKPGTGRSRCRERRLRVSRRESEETRTTRARASMGRALGRRPATITAGRLTAAARRGGAGIGAPARRVVYPPRPRGPRRPPRH